MSKMTNIFDYINEVSLFHNFFYDYSLVEIICPLHGVFEQRKCGCKKCGKLLSTDGKGCPKCAKNYRKDKNEIIKKLNILHNNKYDYSETKFKRTKDILKNII